MARKEFLILTPTRFYWALLRLADKIKSSGYEPEVIVAIARGGVMVARFLCDMLSVEREDEIEIRFYSGVGTRYKEPKVVRGLKSPLELSGRKVLIVDDVVETGSTLSLAKKIVKESGASKIKSAVLYVKPWAKVVPDYYFKVTDRWVVFPHEYGELISMLAEEYKGISEEGLVIYIKRRTKLPLKVIKPLIRMLMIDKGIV